MLIGKGMNRLMVLTLFLLIHLLFIKLTLVGQNQRINKPVIILDDEIIELNNVSSCTKTANLEKVDSVYIKCVAEQLIVYKMNNNISAIDIYWKNVINKDTLYFISKPATKKHIIEQLHLKGIPLGWINPTNDLDSLKSTIKIINNRLALFEFGNIDYSFYRNSKNEMLTLKWYLQNKTKSFIDFVAGFGNSNAAKVGVFGQGKMELNHILSPFSKTQFQFERLSQRNSLISLNHKQLERVLKYGPNQIFVHLSQRDTLFRRNEVQIAWNFFQSNNFMYSLSLFSQAATVSNTSSLSIIPNSGNHTSRGIGLSISYNSINFQRWYNSTNFGFEAKFDQFIKSFQSNNTSLESFSNEYLRRFNINASYYKPLLTSSISLYTKVQLFTLPSSLNLSAAEIINTGGLNSIRSFFENQFFAKDAAIINIENRFKLDRESYFFLFADAARLNINQEIIGSTATKWNNEGRWENLISGGAGIRIFGENIQTQAVVAFSKQSSILNPRIHIGIVRLF